MICVTPSGKNAKIWVTEDEEKYFSEFNTQAENNEKYKIWDAVGDLAVEISLTKEERKWSKKLIVYTEDNQITADYYTVNALIKLLGNLPEWSITTKLIEECEGEQMRNEMFTVTCPTFEDVIGKKLSKVKRDYAHPLDGTLVKFLDNPAVNSVFKQIIDLSADTTFGPVIASGIPINERNYPELNAIIDECVEKLGIKRPYVIMSSSVSGLNAMTFGSDEEPYIAISPFMVRSMSPDQLRFVIGHECGHIAMGHVVYHSVVNIMTNFATAIPVVGPIINMVGAMPLKAWSRRSEISADRAGLICCGSCETAKRTLLQIMMPFMDANEVNMDEYVQNSEKYLKDGIIRKISEFDHEHPIVPKRMHALDTFATSAKYYNVIEEPAPADAIGDGELKYRIEEIIKVL